jgi:hypothetical protein
VPIASSIAHQLPRQTAIFFETHDGQEAWDSVSRDLQAAGFKITCLRERGRYRDGFALRV